MSEVIEHSDVGNGSTLHVGNTNTAISAKTYQDIYHQITGRTEQIRKRYSENLLIELSELEQLHFKIMQLCDVHNIIANNETISVFHEKERKEQFTSFERFKAYNANTASPTVNIVFKYNFSIIPAGLYKPQEYIVTIRLSSRVAMIKQAEDEAPAFMRGRLLNFIGDNTAEITIEYADYVIARGFLEAFDEWVRGCKSVPKPKKLHALRRWSHLIPRFLRIVIVLFIGWFALQAVPMYFSISSKPEAWLRFLIIYSTASIILMALVGFAGDMIEEAIDTFPVLSYLKLNKGDANLIDEFQDRRTSVIIKFTLGAAFSIILGIISSKLEKFL